MEVLVAEFDTHDHILVADDEESLRTVLGMLLRRQGYRVTTVEDGMEALEALESASYAALLTDLRMPGLDGLGLLRRVTARWPTMPVIILTAHGTVDTAVEALKQGHSISYQRDVTTTRLLKLSLRRWRQALCRAQSLA